MHKGVPDHLAHAERRGVERIPLGARDEGDAGGLRHLHDRRLADHAINGLRRPPGRAGHRHRAQLSAESGGERLHRPLAAVGERTHHAFRLGEHAPRALGGGVPRLYRTEAPLERVDGKHNLHCGTLYHTPRRARISHNTGHFDANPGTVFSPPSRGFPEKTGGFRLGNDRHCDCPMHACAGVAITVDV